MGMDIKEACDYVLNGWAPGVESYKLDGNKITLTCRSNSGRSTYLAEVVIKGNGDDYTYCDPYGSNTPWIFGKNVCQMMTDGKITY